MIDNNGGTGSIGNALIDTLTKSGAADLIDKFDANGDGALDAKELKEIGRENDFNRLLKQFDANGDGELDRSELQQLLRSLIGGETPETPASGKGGDAPSGGGRSGDGDSAGGGQKAGGGDRSGGGEKASPSDELLEKYDANGDAKLDAGELDTLARQEGVELGGSDAVARFDTDGDRALDSAELKSAYEEVLSGNLPGGAFAGR